VTRSVAFALDPVKPDVLVPLVAVSLVVDAVSIVAEDDQDVGRINRAVPLDAHSIPDVIDARWKWGGRCAGASNRPRSLRGRAGRNRNRRGAQPRSDARGGDDLVPIVRVAVVVNVKTSGALHADDHGGVFAATPIDQDMIPDLVRAATRHGEEERKTASERAAHRSEFRCGVARKQFRFTDPRARDPATKASRA